MAIDPRISLAGRPSVNLGQRLAQNLHNIQVMDNIGVNRDLAPIQLQQAQRQNEIGEARQSALLQDAERSAGSEAQLIAKQEQMQQIATSYATALKPLLNNPRALVSELQKQKSLFQGMGVPTDGIDEDIMQAQTQEGLSALAQEVAEALSPSSQMSVEQRRFNDMTSGLTEEQKKQAVLVDLGLAPKASSSAAERIAQDAGLASKIIDVEGDKEYAKESGKGRAQLKYKPQIAKAVKLAEAEAAERGETLTKLNRAKASLPGIKEVVSKLSELSLIATSTIAGKVFDVASKELGFGSTKGADARSKLVSIVDNQVLPLLRDTFGAAFTAAEGDRLRDTLVDPDASPTQKKASLDAFLEQKIRDIETSERQLSLQSMGDNVDVTNLSDDELFN